MWSEAKNDAKLDALNDAEFRCWFKLLCAASENEPRGEVGIDDPELLALELRVGVIDLQSALERMKRLRLVVIDDDSAVFPSFENRQYRKPSDKPEATRKRKAKQRVTPESRAGHADATPLQREKEIEKESRADARAEVSDTKHNLPPCMTGDEWAIDGGEFSTSLGHIRRAFENKYAALMAPTHIGELGATLERTCPKGCAGNITERCTCDLIDKIARANNWRTALRFYESDRRDV